MAAPQPADRPGSSATRLTAAVRAGQAAASASAPSGEDRTGRSEQRRRMQLVAAQLRGLRPGAPRRAV